MATARPSTLAHPLSGCAKVEGLAFPQRVRAQNLDLSASARLAYRLAHKHNHEVSPPALLQLLLSPADRAQATVPQIWPTGPVPGVYLSTSQASIDALIGQYQEATDGGVFYAEQSGAKHDAAIDLGDNGLWSSGLERVPSGTLIVLGPVELDQQSWVQASSRLEMACLRAENSGHRVAILFRTPMPDKLGADVTLMMIERGYEDLHEQIIGTVMEDGVLRLGIAREYGAPVVKAPVANTALLPDWVADHIRVALSRRGKGIFAVGSMENFDNPGADIAEAALALTDHVGPAARIMPRHRSTMSKFEFVPAAVGQLPFVASVESAHAQGYRRFLIDPRYTNADTISRFVQDSLFIACTYAATVEELAVLTSAGYGHQASLLPHLLIAVVAASVPARARTEVLVDLYVGPEQAYVDGAEKVSDFVAEHRTLRIEEQFKLLVDNGEIEVEGVRRAGIGQRTMKRLAKLLDREWAAGG